MNVGLTILEHCALSLTCCTLSMLLLYIVSIGGEFHSRKYVQA
jgi:hypothetical protein